ncbi:MAG TPA: molybdenum cofactor guanylyltransferase [Chthoniobacterales bacterium]|nr:molybdenum cofactor guanylyltransferase [Chthoniobacterales bacterium]
MADHRMKMEETGRMTLSALLLAGGESRRMGQDKATIEFEGEPLWQRQLELLRALGPQQLFVSARAMPDWLPPNVELLLDDPPSRGPLSGLTKALAAMRTTHLIALAVDMPLITAGELGRLREAAAADGCGVVPTIGQRAEPLAAIYPANAAEDFRAGLGGLDFSLQRIVGALAEAGKVKLHPIPRERGHFYRSLNTPSDFTEFNA